MTSADRVALILGRAIIRAEALQAELEAANERIRQLESGQGDAAKPAAVK